MTLRIALADENQPELHEELIAAAHAAATESGFSCERLTDPSRERDFDVLLLMGYPEFYPSFLRSPKQTRRISWYGENLPTRSASPIEAIARAIPSARLLDLVHDTVGRVAGGAARNRLLRWREWAAVERELGRNVRGLRRAHGWIDELVVASPNRVIGARLCGWTATSTPFGYHPAFCGPIVPPETGGRDIDVLFLGRDINARGRRARWLADFRSALDDRYRLVIVDHGLYGEERHDLLARARVMVDIHRVPQNSTGLRFLLATTSGVAVVDERTGDEWLRHPEDCVVEVPTEGIAEAVRNLLDDEDRRRRLVNVGQGLLRTELAMVNCLASVLDPKRAA